MSQNTIALTDPDVVEELKHVVQILRDSLETLLEDSDDENEEKENIENSLAELKEIFEVLSWQDAQKYTEQAIANVEALSAFGEGEAESFVLRYCLMLESSLENFTDLGVVNENDILHAFDPESDKESSEINIALIKLLRTMYQKQLLQLIRQEDKTASLNAINALSRDIAASLPTVNAKDWLLISFYLQALLKKEKSLDVQTHRLLALLDGRLSAILSKNDIDPAIAEELMNEVKTLASGELFIEQNVLTQDVYTISPSVYKHFGHGLKDEMVKIHEQLERVYLDQAQRLRLEESLPFLEKLVKVLAFMGLKRLSILTQELLLEFKQLIEEPMNEVKFNELVSQFWVLESFLNGLWNRRFQTVPLSYVETQNWAYISAKQAALKLFLDQYHKLREQITDTKDSETLIALQQKLFDVIKAEGILSVVHDLTRYFDDNFMNVALSQEALLEIVLAVEYISNMNFENREVSDDIIQAAKKYLHIHQQLTAKNHYPTNTVSPDMMEALKDDLVSLEAELDHVMDSKPVTTEKYEDLVRIAHTLHGNASLLKLQEISQLSAALEKNMRGNKAYDDESIELYHKAFLNVFEQFKAFLHK